MDGLPVNRFSGTVSGTGKSRDFRGILAISATAHAGGIFQFFVGSRGERCGTAGFRDAKRLNNEAHRRVTRPVH
jgi:hypothetical protein